MKPVEVPFGGARKKVLRKRIVQDQISYDQLLMRILEKDFAGSADRQENPRMVNKIFSPGDSFRLLPLKTGSDHQTVPEIVRLCVRFHET